MVTKKKLLFLFSDTGGGHRSSMEAVEEAINHLYPGQFTIDKVDFFKFYSPWPLNHSAEMYPFLVKLGSNPWEFFFKLSNKPKLFKKVADFVWPQIKPSLDQLFLDHPSDFIVSFHPLINHYLTKLDKKFAVVITDLITAHYAWFSGKPIKYFVPTLEIKNAGVNLAIDPKIITITGLPISLRFKPKIRIKNLELRIMTILLMGGGQGLGKLFSIAQSLNNSNLSIKLIVIAGRNPKLENQLKAIEWQIPVEIHGFTKDIPALMQKSDILLTKAGPSTICEGLVTGLPIIIYDYLKGQETANVDYLVKNHAGYYCPDINSLTQTLSQLNSLTSLTSSALKLSKPRASIDIAKHIYKLVS